MTSVFVKRPSERYSQRIKQGLRLAQIIGLRLAAILAVGFAIFSTLHYKADQSLMPQGSLWAYVSGVVLLAGLLMADMRHFLPAERAQDPGTEATTQNRTRWLLLIVGVGLLLAAAETSGRAFIVAPLQEINTHTQFALWISGILLTGYALAGGRFSVVRVRIQDRQEMLRTRAQPPTWHERLQQFDRHEVLAVAAILVLAFAMRVYELDEAARFWIDEVHFSNPITHIYANDNVMLLKPFSGIAAFPYLYPYMQSHTVYLVGQNLGGLRLVSSLFGVAGVLALYLLARVSFGVRVALLAGALLAVLPVHVQHSRIGLNNIADPFFGTMTFYFMLRGFKNPDRMPGNFAWAGVMLGMTQYFYEGGRFLFPIVTVVWLAAVIILHYIRGGSRAMLSLVRKNLALRPNMPQTLLHKQRRALVVFVVAAVFIAAPVYYTLLGQDLPLASRMDTAGVGARSTEQMVNAEGFLTHFINRINEAFAIHVSIPEAQFYYGSDDPMIPPTLLPLFLLGVFYVLWLGTLGTNLGDGGRTKLTAQAAAMLLIMWLGATWFGNAFMEQSRISARYVVEFPAIALICALGLDIIAGLLFNATRWRRYALAAALAAFVTVQVFYFFGSYMTLYNEQFRTMQRGRNLDADDLVFRAQFLPEGTIIHVIDDPVMYEVDINNKLHFLRGGPQRTLLARSMLPGAFEQGYLSRIERITPHAFFVDPDDAAVIARLTGSFADLAGPFYTTHAAAEPYSYALYVLPSLNNEPIEVAE